FAAIGVKPLIEYIDMPEEIRGQYQYYTQAKMDKLKASGCDYKFMPLEDAIKDYSGYLNTRAYL
ncbi:MAG TPA: ADP-glyceromanno-heptose 6-epimerase, partial [Candidatus Omnitrophota bacterium]|nr:ADP-glyceromanno-heptose 6-epimerase [Candidatus Omnitrophota bacterium]